MPDTTAHHKQAQLIKAMAHPTRLQILEILSRYESCVCHLEAILRRPQANISQHLAVLREAGLVADRKDGLIVYYRLADDLTCELLATTRQLLLHQNPGLRFPPVPDYPVPGCHCPYCTVGGECPSAGADGASMSR